MGRTGSKLAQKVSSHFTGGDDTAPEQGGFCIRKSNAMATPFVLIRKGSMFFDEDDDLAHEFYEEVPPPRKGCKATMKRILNNLRPQGDVAHPFPRLHVDFPIVLYQG